MKIVIDARWIGAAPSGIGVYAKELIKRLPLLAPDWHFHLLFDDAGRRAEVLRECGHEDNDMVSAEVLPYGIFTIEGQMRLPVHLRRLSPDLFHSPNYMLPYGAFQTSGGNRRGSRRTRCVTTIHDVIPLLLHDHAPRSRKSRMLPLFRHCLRLSIRRSDAVLTVSRTSRRDMIGALRLVEADAAKIHVVYNGVDEHFIPPAAPPPADACRTILYVGRLDPYKQVVTLIRAFGQLQRQLGERLHLLIVGPDDPRYPEARRMVSDLGLNNSVTFLGFLRDRELTAAYQESSLLINPSLYEGFGLQLIEAMRCGLPVICCSGGAQEEVTAHAARIVVPGDTHALTQAMAEVLQDEKLRSDMIGRGLQRARDFDWNKTASETLEVYRQALAKETIGQ